MKTGHTEVQQEFLLQASSDGGKTWEDEEILSGPKEAVLKCFDSRQRVYSIQYRAVQRLTLTISPAPNERAHV